MNDLKQYLNDQLEQKIDKKGKLCQIVFNKTVKELNDIKIAQENKKKRQEVTDDVKQSAKK